MNNRRFIVHISVPSSSPSFRARRFSDFTEADNAARDNNGLLYELENGQTDLDIDDDNNIINGKLIKDYSAKQG